MNEQNQKMTKARIFEAAIKLFSDKGYSKVSVRDIAKEVNIKVSSIYNHYSSKADILKAIYDYYLAVQKQTGPNMKLLLQQVGTLPPHEILHSQLHCNLKPILIRMIELNQTEPLDVDAFLYTCLQ